MSYYQTALAAFGDGRYEQALADIRLHLGQGETLGGAVAWLIAECAAGLGQPGQAMEFFGMALQDPAFATAERFLHMAEYAQAHASPQEAQIAALKAKRLAPDDPEANFFLFRLLSAEEDQALRLACVPPLLQAARPDHLNALIEHFGIDRTNPLSLDLFKRLSCLYPERGAYAVAAFLLAREFCDVDYMDALAHIAPQDIWAGRQDLIGGETPLDNIYWCGDERINRLAASLPGGAAKPFDPNPRRASIRPETDGRLRIGYLSCDFFPDHATMRLLADVLRRHDRIRFDITLFCHTEPALRGAPHRSGEWGRIIDVHGLDDEAMARRIRAEEIDILVDLKGHTGNTRSQVLNHGCAPIQVAWLGFPGSTVGIDVDYVISDRFVTPDSAAAHYHEAFCRLPDSYQPNDPTRPDPPAASRMDLRLPDSAFVFACFNSPRKLNSRVLRLWAEILAGAPHAVLWLLADNQRLAFNIRRRFESLGIDPGRILFAPPLPMERHLARLKAADVALDPFPCNGHTTTSDALWAGLPVIAMEGTNFASRVSQSLLNAIGLPELVAPDEARYVQLAIDLAHDTAGMRRLRLTLEENRSTAPLFDSARFVRHLEQAYSMMWDRALAGKPPQPFDVPATETA